MGTAVTRAWSWTVAVLLVVVVQGGIAAPADAASSAPSWGEAQRLAFGGEPTSLSCPSDGFCAASGDENVVVLKGGRWQQPTVMGPTGYSSAVSCASATSCVTVFGHRYSVYDGSSWSSLRPVDADLSSGHAFETISCPQVTFCLAGGADGSSALFDGQRWSPGPSVPVTAGEFLRGFLRLSCTGPTFCMALVEGDEGEVIYRWRGTAWTVSLRESATTAGGGAISCVSDSFCIGAGSLEGTAQRWDGTTWSSTVVDTNPSVGTVMPSGLSCVTASLCVAVGSPLADSYRGYAYQFDGGSWSARSAPSPKVSPDMVSCASAHFCMALTEDGWAIPVVPATSGGGATNPDPVDQPPRFESYPRTTVYPGDRFTVRATDPDGDPVTLGWSTLPQAPVKVTCTLVAANEARCSAETAAKADYAPANITFTARSRQLTAQAAARVSLRRYVGLGDSYSSGEGAEVKDFDDGTHFQGPTGDTGCHRSRTSWETLLERQLLATKTVESSIRVACSGARFTDLFNDNLGYAEYGERERAQLVVVNRDTYVATMTMGGNDVGFEAILTDCTVWAKNPKGEGCRKPHRTARDTADRGLRALKTGLTISGTGHSSLTAADVYENIAERMADGGTLVVGGYPHLFDTRKRRYVLPVGYCAVTETDLGPLGKVSRKDTTWVNDVVDDGNKIIRKSVGEAQLRLKRSGFKTKVVYADPVQKFGTKTVCSGVTKSLINYAILRATPKPGPTRQSFHPKKTGQAAYYKSFCDLVPVGKGVDDGARCKEEEPS